MMDIYKKTIIGNVLGYRIDLEGLKTIKIKALIDGVLITPLFTLDNNINVSGIDNLTALAQFNAKYYSPYDFANTILSDEIKCGEVYEITATFGNPEALDIIEKLANLSGFSGDMKTIASKKIEDFSVNYGGGGSNEIAELRMILADFVLPINTIFARLNMGRQGGDQAHDF